MTHDIEEQSLAQRADVKRNITMIDQCIEFLEHDTKGIRIVMYGMTTIGLLTALYRIRPFAKFIKPSDVPSHFIKLMVPLQGKVVRIEPSHGALIMVDHKPLVNLPRRGAPTHLPVKVAGVDVTNHGVSWLQTVVCSKKIEFVPVARKTDYLECTINLQDTKEITMPIGEELVRLGFGTVGNLERDPSNNQQIVAYKAALNAAQKRAILERNGYWHFAIYPTWLWKLGNLMHVKLYQTLPTRISRQLNI